MKPTVNPTTEEVADRESFFIPLNKLVLSPDQVRKTPPTKEGIQEMAAMLLSQGQLNPLQVTKGAEGDQYFVHAGGRRLRGLELLASQGKIMPDFPIECKKVDPLEATAIGLMENISVEPMHPADEYEAFKALADKGHTVGEIATRYGTKPLHIQRRLKLATLAPELMAIFRKGEIQLDQVMALVQLDDQSRQVMLYKGLPPHNRSAHAIRRLISAEEVPATDPRVKLVTIKAYLEMGGGIREDLFSEKKGERFLTDPLLLDMLMGELFEVEAAKLKDSGWGWVDVQPNYTFQEQSQYFTLPARTIPESEQQRETRVALEANEQELEASYDACEDDEELEAIEAKLNGVRQQLTELAAGLIDTASIYKDIGGVVLTVQGGKIQCIENLGRVSDRKSIQAEVLARQKRAANEIANQDGEDGGGMDTALSAQKVPEQLVDDVPERLMLNLSAHRTAAIQASMVANKKVALAALALRVANSVFSHRLRDEAIKITLSDAWHVLEKSSPTVGTSLAANVMTQERSRLQALLPKDPDTWLQWFIDQPLECSLGMIVFGAAGSTNALQGRADGHDVAADLAKALNVDMTAWWEPTPANYLDLVPKSKLIEVVTEAKGAVHAKDMHKLKKPEAIAYAAQALTGTGWLPQPLRIA